MSTISVRTPYLLPLHQQRLGFSSSLDYMISWHCHRLSPCLSFFCFPMHPFISHRVRWGASIYPPCLSCRSFAFFLFSFDILWHNSVFLPPFLRRHEVQINFGIKNFLLELTLKSSSHVRVYVTSFCPPHLANTLAIYPSRYLVQVADECTLRKTSPSNTFVFTGLICRNSVLFASSGNFSLL